MPFVAPDFLSKTGRSRVQPGEWVAILYALGIIVVCAAFRERIPGWYYYAAGHAAIAIFTAVMTGARSPSARLFRAFDMLIYIPAFFFMVCPLIHRVHPVDYDAQLIAIDRSIGGIGALAWMRSIETPLLTLLAKASWISYYVVAIIPGVALYRRPTPQAFEETKLILVLGWLLSYAAYFAVPAEGPGYHAAEIGVPQPAWDETASKAKAVIYALEGDARDTFPSGHVVIAALVVFVCLRNRLGACSLVGVPMALGIMVSTLYLRYHYLTDVLSGLALAAVCAGAGVAWYRRYDERKIGLE